MREIKFRAWSIQNKEMFVPKNLMLFEGRFNGISFGEKIEEKVGPGRFVLMQYTGLLDRLGREIYEGDIVKHGTWKNEVTWVECGFAPFGFSVFGDEGYEAEQCEIIGNIYEDGHLLKDEKGL